MNYKPIIEQVGHYNNSKKLLATCIHNSFQGYEVKFFQDIWLL